MNNREKKFLADSERNALDLGLRKKINYTLKQSDDAFNRGSQQFRNLETARKTAKNVKWNAIENLDKYLLEFESNFTLRGGKVIWAENAGQALDAIKTICIEKRAKTIVKSKSMVTEEIGLNSFLESDGIDIIETDLGEFIQQLDGEPPYHIVAPAMHKSKEDVARLFHRILDVPEALSPEQLTLVARERLRKKFREADIGITGANFIVADVGGIAITENEGNAWLSASFPKTHIAITGIEKILPSINDLELFWPLLATHGSGQRLTTYSSIISGPRQRGEVDGPEEMYVILLDNGRTTILSDPVFRESLYCIRCGACLNVCPVYRNIGGHTYNATYSGPIGSIITPHLVAKKEYKHLSYASTLCGSCTQICPVHINLHGLLLKNRRESVLARHNSRIERWIWLAWEGMSLRRWVMNLAGRKSKNLFLTSLFSKAWGGKREFPIFSPKSFNQLWREHKKREGFRKES